LFARQQASTCVREVVSGGDQIQPSSLNCGKAVPSSANQYIPPAQQQHEPDTRGEEEQLRSATTGPTKSSVHKNASNSRQPRTTVNSGAFRGAKVGCRRRTRNRTADHSTRRTDTTLMRIPMFNNPTGR